MSTDTHTTCTHAHTIRNHPLILAAMYRPVPLAQALRRGPPSLTRVDTHIPTHNDTKTINPAGLMYHWFKPSDAGPPFSHAWTHTYLRTMINLYQPRRPDVPLVQALRRGLLLPKRRPHHLNRPADAAAHLHQPTSCRQAGVCCLLALLLVLLTYSSLRFAVKQVCA